MSGRPVRFAAREIIVSSGAIHSPALLMRSGIGPAEHLRDHGISVVADRPGVGANLQDHPLVGLGVHLKPQGRLDPLLRNPFLIYARFSLRNAGLSGPGHEDLPGQPLRREPDRQSLRRGPGRAGQGFLAGLRQASQCETAGRALRGLQPSRRRARPPSHARRRALRPSSPDDAGGASRQPRVSSRAPIRAGCGRCNRSDGWAMRPSASPGCSWIPAARRGAP